MTPNTQQAAAIYGKLVQIFDRRSNFRDLSAKIGDRDRFH
jgi:hypothetical protein